MKLWQLLSMPTFDIDIKSWELTVILYIILVSLFVFYSNVVLFISNYLKQNTKDCAKTLISSKPFVPQFISSVVVYFVCPLSNLRVVRVFRDNHSTMGLLLLILLGYDYVFTVEDTIHYSFGKWMDGVEVWLYLCLPFATIYYILFILFFVNNFIEF